MSVTIRAATKDDRAQWEPLWQAYQAFYKVEIPPETTDLTWARFFDPAEPMHATVAERNGRLLGLVHSVFHRNTWMSEPVCYLQDLFTVPEARGQGVGRALIEAVYAQARAAGAPRVYWLTHETNAQAMALYDTLADRSGFLVYRKAM